MEAEGRNEPPSDGEFRPQPESLSKCPSPMIKTFKGGCCSRSKTAGATSDYPKQPIKERHEARWSQECVEPSSSGEDERMTESPSNASPPKKGKIIARIETSDPISDT